MTEKAKLAWQAQHAPTAASGSPHIGAECPMTDQSRLAWQSQQTETVVRENMMPPPNQIPAPGQTMALSTQRVVSTIPRTVEFTPEHQKDAGSTWVYPSEQMFYNAMKRKGHEPTEEDMRAVVAIHNVVNERAWKHVMEWEQLCHSEQCKLVRFEGKPTELSPKARILGWIGYDAPFDRHDWYIRRNEDGAEVRYVIDFYNGREDLLTGKPAMYLDVRPALDSLGAMYYRARRCIFH